MEKHIVVEKCEESHLISLFYMIELKFFMGRLLYRSEV
jgi:hypothetical protein